MKLEFFYPQGLDCGIYLNLANICAQGGNCWHDMRPAGFVYYASIPFRMGWRPEALVAMNLSLAILSILLAGLALPHLFSALKNLSFPAKVLKYGLIALVHYVFMWGDCHFPASDAPAAGFALSGIWLLILAWGGNRAWLFPLAGLFLGLSTSMRVFYLYPLYAFLGFFSLAALVLRRMSPSSLAAFLMMAFLPILIQFALTFKHTGHWSILDPRTASSYNQQLMDIPAYGFDGIQQDGHLYQCEGCFKGPGGWVSAKSRGDWAGIARLLWKRQGFYFANYVARPNQAALSDRIVSNWIAVAHALAFLLAWLAWWRSKERWLILMILVFLGAIWGESSLIIPENRFMVVVFVFLWSSALVSVLGREKPAPQEALPQPLPEPFAPGPFEPPRKRKPRKRR